MFLSAVFSFILLVITFTMDEFGKQHIILLIMLLPLYYLFLESQIRQVIITEEKLVCRRLTGSLEINFSDISQLEITTIRKKAFLVIK